MGVMRGASHMRHAMPLSRGPPFSAAFPVSLGLFFRSVRRPVLRPRQSTREPLREQPHRNGTTKFGFSTFWSQGRLSILEEVLSRPYGTCKRRRHRADTLLP